MTNSKLKLVKSITVIGREHFDRSGVTYFTGVILVNGKRIGILPYESGYGDYYIQRAGEWLNNSHYVALKQHPNGSFEPLWQYCRERNIVLYSEIADVKRKSDLHNH